MPESQTRPLCSFCLRERRDIIAGPAGVAICSECVALCQTILTEQEARDEAPRTHHPSETDEGIERETLQAALNRQRRTMRWKVQGLDHEAALRQLVPSGTTLLGMVKHLAYMERKWFRSVLAGEDMSLPWTEDGPNADWRIEPGDIVDSILTFYQHECDAADQAVSGYALGDVPAGQPPYMTLRWIMTHMIEETARHCGQADILRELTDGKTGE